MSETLDRCLLEVVTLGAAHQEVVDDQDQLGRS
jgi:hypothetical protein